MPRLYPRARPRSERGRSRASSTTPSSRRSVRQGQGCPASAITVPDLASRPTAAGPGAPGTPADTGDAVRHRTSEGGDQLLDALVATLERVLAQHGSLGLVVQLEV